METWVLSLPETLCTYLGLAWAMLLRDLFLLRGAVIVLVAWNTGRLLWEHSTSTTPWKPAVTYFLGSLLLAILFWPEVTKFRGLAYSRTASQVGSYAAQQDGEADLITAADLQQQSLGLANTLADPVRGTERALLPPGMHLILNYLTDGWLRVAKMVNSQAHRPLASLVPMEWLAGMSLTADTTRALQDWLEGCYKPSLLQDQEFEEAITAEQLSPWGTTLVAQALASREVTIGAQTGKGYYRRRTPLGASFLQNPSSDPTKVRCDIYLKYVELDVQQWLANLPSPSGTPVSEIFAKEFGLDMEQQGRFILNREMRRLMGQPVPAPSLAGTYAGLSAANAALGAANGALQGRGAGALLGGGRAVLSQTEHAVQRLLWWVGIATWLLWWLPYILGILELVLLGCEPLVVLWMLYPGQQLRAFLIYFVTLSWVYSSPVWFALTDLMARIAGSLATKSQDPLLSALNWAPEQLNSAVVTVIALPAIPVLLAAILTFTLYKVMGNRMSVSPTP